MSHSKSYYRYLLDRHLPVNIGIGTYLLFILLVITSPETEYILYVPIYLFIYGQLGNSSVRKTEKEKKKKMKNERRKGRITWLGSGFTSLWGRNFR